MSKFLAFVIFLAAAGYLAREYAHRTQPPPPPPPAPPAASAPDRPMFSDQEINKIRESLKDGDPAVRWAAVQLLDALRDPQLGPLLDQMIAEDPDEDLRIKIVGLMRGRENLGRLGGLVKGLGDTEKDVRIASLRTLGDIGDPSVVTWVIALLKDPEPDVRIAALRTLGRFEDKRKAEFRALADKLKADYEEALRRRAAAQS